MSGLTTEDLLRRFAQKDTRSLSKIISLIENNSKESQDFLRALYPKIGRAYRIGITGAPGTGKSTLVERLAFFFLENGKNLGIVCVDPSSPITGGAILGDRVRMSSLFLEKRVYIRSMATRGSLGGLALRTKEVVDVLDAFGKEIIIIETVGVGQVEIEISKTSHTVIVVLTPESGDTIQVMKAGLLEIGDIFVVNKSDREGAERLAQELTSYLKMKEGEEWSYPVILTNALTGEGLPQLFSTIQEHERLMSEKGIWEKKRKEIILSEIKELTEEELREKIWEDEKIKELLAFLVKEVMAGKITPFEGRDRILELIEKRERRGNG